MRDILIIAIVAIGVIAALRRPWIGVLLWTWLSMMSPHRMAWGIAYDAPLAAIAAGVTLLGLIYTRDKSSPFKGTPTVMLLLFSCWFTLSWLFGLDVSGDYPQWEKVLKINFMVFVAMALINHKRDLFALIWVTAGSLALLGAKGGVFTIMTGGNYKVWGPPGSFIEDNNEFALALVMTIPLLRFLQMQLTNRLGRHLMTLWMMLCAASALGSHSRGGLLAIVAMTLVMWWRGRNKFFSAVLIGAVGVALLLFMPAEWTGRMETIQDYSQDRSALGRFSAWWTAWRLAFDYPLGVGFFAARPELFQRYSPYPELGTPAAHSIYFQVLGNHGFIGLFLFLLIWLTTYYAAGRLRTEAANIPQARWCVDLGGMCQVALVGYAVGGAFLSLAYFDLPYYVMAFVVIARSWLKRRGWENEPAPRIGRIPIPGLAAATPPTAAVRA